MYNIEFFEDKNGKKPVLEYIQGLEKKSEKNKSARIELDKINQSIDIVRKTGTSSGPPLIRNLEDNLYKIRAIKSRFFFLRDEDTFVFLTHFKKTTQKTPEKEKNIARRRRRKYYDLKSINSKK